MRTKFLLIMLALVVGHFYSNAFILESKPSDSIVPVRTIQQDDNGVTVSYQFPGAIAIQDDLFPSCKSLEIPGFGKNLTLEEPAWPVRIDSFEIPDGCEAEVSVVSSNWSNLNLSLPPSRPLLVDSSDEVYSLDNVPVIKNFNGTLPVSP